MIGLKFDQKKRKARFEVTMPGTGGSVRRRATVTAKNRVEAETKFYEFRQKVQAEFEELLTQTDPQRSPVVGEWFTANWPTISANMKPRTAKKNLETITNHIIPFFGSLRFADITEALVEDFRVAMQAKRYGAEKKPYSAAFINDCMRQLHAVLNRAAKRNMMDRMPAFPKVLKEAKPMLELSSDEEAAFLAAFDDRAQFIARLKKPEVRGSVLDDTAKVYFSFFRASKPIFVVALHTALRRSDLIGLEWSAVDLKRARIRLMTEKTAQPVFIPLSKTALAALEECRDRAIASTRWVFVQQDGSRFSLTTFRRHFAKAKELAGIIRRFRPHDLRHTAACKMASEGVSLQVIAKVLGHTSTRMSERYARPDEAAVRQIAAAMERASASSDSKPSSRS